MKQPHALTGPYHFAMLKFKARPSRHWTAQMHCAYALRPSASRSRKSLFNVKTLQYAGSLNCVPFQKIEGKAGNPSSVQKGPASCPKRNPHRSGPSHAAGMKPGNPIGSGQGWSPSHTVRACPVRSRPGCTELEFPTRGKGTPGSRTAGGLWLTPPHMPEAHRMPWSNPALSAQIAHMPRARRNLWAESPKPSPQRAKGT